MQTLWYAVQLFFYIFLFFIGVLMECFNLKYGKRMFEYYKKIKLAKASPLLVLAVGIIVLTFIGGFVPAFSSFVNFGFNGSLVLVTAVYVAITSDILNEEKKSREIEFMQKQLEFFYYPWLRIMEKVNQVSFDKELYFPEPDDYCINCLRKTFPIIIEGYQELHKYQYLSNDDIRKKIEGIEQYMGLKPIKVGRAIESTQDKPYRKQSYTYYDDLYPEDCLIHDQEEIFDYVMSFKNDLTYEIDRINRNLMELIKKP